MTTGRREEVKKVPTKGRRKIKGEGSTSAKKKAKTKDTKKLSGATKSTAKKKRKTKKDKKIMHWTNVSDQAVVDVEPNSKRTRRIQSIRLVVQGNPLPLRRHRTSRGFVYNPSAPAQASFRNITERILDQKVPQILRNETNGTSLPLFPADQPLVMTILFRMKRPNLHFIGNKPGPDRLREKAPTEMAPTRTDVDNLAKFVLDSLNGILYEDDRQINSLHVTKLLDSDGLCLGSTEICCRPLTESDLPSLIENSFNPLEIKT